jgi:hypothetical protein
MPFVKINKCIVMDREREVSCTYPTVLQCEIISKQRQWVKKIYEKRNNNNINLLLNYVSYSQETRFKSR